MGEIDCNMSRKCVLKGLNGTGFVDEQKKEAVTGYINVEFIYKVGHMHSLSLWSWVEIVSHSNWGEFGTPSAKIGILHLIAVR
jgi:hypothetical protein